MSDSQWDDPRVTAYVLGELTESERSEFETEMALEPSLKDAVEQSAAVCQTLRSHYELQSQPVLSPRRREEILNASRREVGEVIKVRPVMDSNRNLRMRMGILAACAAALLCLVSFGAYRFIIPETRIAGASKTPTADSSNRPRTTVFTMPKYESGADPTIAKLNDIDLYALDEMDLDAPATDSDAMNMSEMETHAPPIGRGNAVDVETTKRVLGDRTDEMGMGGMDMEFGIGTEFGMGMDDMVGGMGMGGMRQAESLVESKARKARSRNATMGMDGMGMEGDGMMGGMGMGGTSQTESQVKPEPRKSRSRNAAMGMGMGGMGMGGGGMSGMEDMGMGMEPLNMGMAGMGMDGDRMGMGMEMRGTKLHVLPSDAMQGDQFEALSENAFQRVQENPLSTFSVDVDTASYAQVRSYLRRGQLPTPEMIRTEELINAFPYDYAFPNEDDVHPVALNVSVSDCPWQPGHRLARIALQGQPIIKDPRPACNLVFLIDTSGSMADGNKLPLVVQGLKLLVGELDQRDRITIVTYANSATQVLPPTPANQKLRIIETIDRLRADGGTNGGHGLEMAYRAAKSQYNREGVNRVILCSDGDFNAGVTDPDRLVQFVKGHSSSNVFLTVLGFGHGNLNDPLLERLSGEGNGNYGFVDSFEEAKTWFVDRITETLVTVAKDVKVQVEFNPRVVSAYRLIGYENRTLNKRDFNDDSKDAGEIGSGGQVTMLYEWVPAGTRSPANRPLVDPLKYGRKSSSSIDRESNRPEVVASPDAGEAMTVKLRYKRPSSNQSQRFEVPVQAKSQGFEQSDPSLQWAATVAAFGMQLGKSRNSGQWSWIDIRNAAIRIASDAPSEQKWEFVRLVKIAESLSSKL